MSNGLVWRAAQDRLRQQMSRAQFETWLRGTWLTTADDGATVLAVRSTFARELLETRFRDRIESAITSVTGQPCTLRIAVAMNVPDEESQADDGAAGVSQSHGQRSSTHKAPHHGKPAPSGPTLFGSNAASEDEHSPGIDAESGQVRDVSVVRRAPVTGPLRKRGTAGSSGNPALGDRVRAAIDRTRSTRQDVNRNGTRGWPGQAQPEDTEPGTRGDPEQQETDSLAVAAVEDDDQARMRRDRRDGSATMSGQISPQRDRETGKPGDLGKGSAPDRTDYRAPQFSTQNTPPPALQAPRLNERYTFSTFIVGSANQLAHAASQAVAEAPGMAYNPLFLYGGVGLGKTHLLHAIGHTALEHDLTVLYVSSETFTNEIINAIRYRTTEEFRAKYRSVDVLLVDDIQFIAGKESTEDEFFHTFNALYDENKQIVICSDRPPKAIVSLEERLRSRFEWGLIADIQPPDLETRVAILRAKADALKRTVPDDVVTFIATRVQSNIRELEGTFNRLLAFSELQGFPLSIETAKSALANLAADVRPRKIDIAQVLDAVAEYYHISATDLRGKARDKHIIVPRHVAMYLMRQETDASLLEIGQALGGRDHSTVLHACDKIGREINENTALRKEVLALRQQILG